MRKFITVIAGISLALMLSLSTSFAYFETFFGEDLGLGESTRLPSWANSAGAEAAFLSNLVGTGTEDFESYAADTSAPLGITFPGAGTATLSGSGYVQELTGTDTWAGRYPISGDKLWGQVTSDLFYVEFSAPVAAFGFYGIDLGDFQGQIEVTLTNGSTEVYEIPHTVGAPGGSVCYWGIIDTENLFTKIDFSNTGSSADYFGFDDFTIGSYEQVVPTPEPSTMLLLGFGLLGLVGLRRK